MELTKCDVKIPKSGKKIIPIGEFRFFFRKLKNLSYVYEVDTKNLIMVTTKDNDWIVSYIENRIDEVKEMHEKESEA